MVKVPLSLKQKDSAKSAPRSADDEIDIAVHSQKKPAEGRYRLQVDRQTKASYDTFEEAQTQGLRIKKQFAHVRVAIYDAQESKNTVLELSA